MKRAEARAMLNPKGLWAKEEGWEGEEWGEVFQAV